MKHALQAPAQRLPAPSADTTQTAKLKTALNEIARVLGRQAAAEFVRGTSLSSSHPNMEPCA